MPKRLLPLSLLTAVALSGCSMSVDSRPSEESDSKALTSACRSFAVEGGTAAQVALEATRDAVAMSEWSPDSYGELFGEAKAGVAAAAKTEALSDSEFAAFRELSEALTRGEHSLTAPDGYPTRRTVEALSSSLTAVNDLCGFEAGAESEE